MLAIVDIYVYFTCMSKRYRILSYKYENFNTLYFIRKVILLKATIYEVSTENVFCLHIPIIFCHFPWQC